LRHLENRNELKNKSYLWLKKRNHFASQIKTRRCGITVFDGHSYKGCFNATQKASKLASGTVDGKSQPEDNTKFRWADVAASNARTRELISAGGR
jgi:hypothetical protein